jgi:GNAT superfamily N-acetyltransferase
MTLPGWLYYRRELLVVRKELRGRDGDDRGARPPRSAARRLTVREASRDDLAAVLARERDAGRARRLRRYALLGYRCFLALLEGEPVGQLWWVDGTVRPSHPDVERLGIRLAPTDVYGIYVYVVPERRRGGVASAFLAAAEAELARRGYRSVVGDVDAEAIEPRWLFATHGYEVVDTVAYRRVLRVLALYDGRVVLMPSPAHLLRELVARARARAGRGEAANGRPAAVSR